jgi:hypothetical protein
MTLMNKKVVFLKDKTNELGANSKDKNSEDLYGDRHI